MDGEQFCIVLAENVILFLPFAYRDKLKAQLELLQQQGIIAPITGQMLVRTNCKKELTASECV